MNEEMTNLREEISKGAMENGVTGKQYCFMLLSEAVLSGQQLYELLCLFRYYDNPWETEPRTDVKFPRSHVTHYNEFFQHETQRRMNVNELYERFVKSLLHQGEFYCSQEAEEFLGFLLLRSKNE